MSITAAVRGDSVAAPPEAAAQPRLARLRAALLDAPYTLCTSKAELLTEWFRDNDPSPPLTRLLAPWHFAVARAALARSLGTGAPQNEAALAVSTGLQRLYAAEEDGRRAEPAVVRFANALGHVLANMELRAWDDELILGNCTSARIGAAIHPDYGGLLLLPELETLATRRVNPLATTPAQVRRLREEVFPFWFPRSVLARAPLLARDPSLANTLVHGRDFVLTQFAGISHVTPDHPAVLEKGFGGILEDVDRARRRAETPSQVAFLDAAAIVARAAIAHGERWRSHCLAEARRSTDPVRAAELAECARIFEQVPARPARTLREALQSVFLTHAMLHQESFQHGISFGRLDQYLRPYFERDLASGRLTREGAVELLGCFLGKAAEQVPLFNAMATEFFSGLSSASGITLGGTDARGEDASSDLTHAILDTYDRMRLRQPNLHLRVHPATPRDVLDHALDVLRRGGGMPALFNDPAIVPAVRATGASGADASDYAIVGCVEWGVPRKSFPAAGAAFVSLPAVLDDVLHVRDGAHDSSSRPSARFHQMSDLASALRDAMADRVAAAADGNDAIEEAHRLYRPTPLLSVLVDGCIASGRDVTDGGACYNTSGMQGVGLADVADSLAAIEEVVFARRQLTLDELVRVLDADFEGAEVLRRRLADKVARYGEDEGRAERWAHRVASDWTALVAARRNRRGGHYAAGFWTMTTHVGFGSRLGALPSGRRAGRPLADGISPANGADRRGPTASMMAAVAAASSGVGNGAALNEKLAPWIVAGEKGLRLMEDLVRGYFAAGGQQVQFNILDAATLIDAKAHPERHRDLVVRISGYSAYFNDLTDEMKDDLIARTQHGDPAAATGPACSTPPVGAGAPA